MSLLSEIKNCLLIPIALHSRSEKYKEEKVGE